MRSVFVLGLDPVQRSLVCMLRVKAPATDSSNSNRSRILSCMHVYCGRRCVSGWNSVPDWRWGTDLARHRRSGWDS